MATESAASARPLSAPRASSQPPTTQAPTTQPPTAAIVPEKCLTICEPWAWAIAAGFKPVENRIWSTSFRGRIAIHASTSGRHLTIETQEFLFQASPQIGELLERPAGEFELFNFGAIVGTVDLLGCIDLELANVNGEEEFRRLVTDQCGQFGDWYDRQWRRHNIPPGTWAEGPIMWVLDNAVQFARPIRAKGALNLWDLDSELREAIEAELAYTASNPPRDAMIAAEHIVAPH